jgi:hypothetical protein
MGDSLSKQTRPNSLTDTRPRIERLQNRPTTTGEPPAMEKQAFQRCSSCLLI